MVTGGFPFSSTKESKVFKKISKGDIILPDYISDKCKDLIKQLLNLDPDSRITAEQVLKHPWIVEKSRSVNHNLPHGGDNIEVSIEEDAID